MSGLTDDETVRDMMRAILKEAGHDLDEAAEKEIDMGLSEYGPSWGTGPKGWKSIRELISEWKLDELLEKALFDLVSRREAIKRLSEWLTSQIPPHVANRKDGSFRLVSEILPDQARPSVWGPMTDAYSKPRRVVWFELPLFWWFKKAHVEFLECFRSDLRAIVGFEKLNPKWRTAVELRERWGLTEWDMDKLEKLAEHGYVTAYRADPHDGFKRAERSYLRIHGLNECLFQLRNIRSVEKRVKELQSQDKEFLKKNPQFLPNLTIGALNRLRAIDMIRYELWLNALRGKPQLTEKEAVELLRQTVDTDGTKVFGHIDVGDFGRDRYLRGYLKDLPLDRRRGRPSRKK